MMGELTVFVRILLFIAAGYLANAGLPPALVDMITNDPGTAELVSHGIAAVLALLVYLWSRLARWMGWAT
ncbi:MAG: hypothetical protein ACK4MS_10460 [Paracoccaceae bacterium]